MPKADQVPTMQQKAHFFMRYVAFYVVLLYAGISLISKVNGSSLSTKVIQSHGVMLFLKYKNAPS